ncbi:MAG TPA: type II toxin-antitoxin system YafQ family toxin [Bacilli bacterium]|nr:type II toxin-antitoxin system YafQ family toxin [Bacilli bacterium]
MKYSIKVTSIFKKDLKRVKKRNLDKEKLEYVIECLINQSELDEKYKDHQLITDKKYINNRECHIEPDWLLIYSVSKDEGLVILIRTRSHSDLFK